MGASGKMDAKIPPVAGELCLRFKLRPAVRVLAQYSVLGVTAAANSSVLCTRNDHIGDPKPFNVMLMTGRCVLYGTPQTGTSRYALGRKKERPFVVSATLSALAGINNTTLLEDVIHFVCLELKKKSEQTY